MGLRLLLSQVGAHGRLIASILDDAGYAHGRIDKMLADVGLGAGSERLSATTRRNRSAHARVNFQCRRACRESRSRAQ